MSELKIEITSRHGSLSDRLRAYAEAKVAKLSRFNDRLSRVHMVFDSLKVRERFVEMVVHSDTGHVFVAKQQGEHVRETVDQVVEKIARQLKKDKEKLKQHHKPDASKGGIRKTRVADAEPAVDEIAEPEKKSRREPRR
jgi:putative sigma-54 modulation protein